MKKKLISMLAIVSLLLVISCTKDEIGDSAELTLSEKVISVEAKATEKTVIVTTDQDNWKAFATASEWVTLTQNGATLVIKVAENKSVKGRKCNIVLMAGSANETIELTQKGAEGSATITPEDIKVDQYEGNLVVDIVGNDKDWTATTDADWITLTPKQYKYELGIQYAENIERTDRIAKIIVTIGDVNKEIVVQQSGILFYLLPYLNFRGNFRDIKTFETARKSDMIDRVPYADDWNYDTKSPYFYRIRYFMKDASGKSYQESHTYARNVEEFQKELPGFRTFLEDNGFKLENGKTDLYHNEEKSVSAEITIIKDKDIAAVVYRYVPKQDKAYPTFKKLPNIPELAWGATNQDLQDYEAANNGTPNSSFTQIDPSKMFDILTFDVNSTDDEIPFMRMYMTGHDNMGGVLFKDGLIIKDVFFKNTELAYYRGHTGDYFLTKEFLQLAKDSGYGDPTEGTNDYTDFKNTAENTVMKVKISPNFNNTLEIIFQRIDGIAKANSNSFSNGLSNVE